MVRLKSKNKKGLTLLELVIVLGLMGIVTMLVFSFTNTTQKKSKELEIRQKLQHEGTMITESFMSNVLQAEGIKKITLKNSGQNIIDNIEFKIKDGVLKNNSLIDEICGMEYKISSSDNKLKLIANRDLDTDKDNYNPSTEIYEVQEVTNYVKSVEILNEDIKKIIANNHNINIIAEDMLKDIKSINLKITLEDEYYNKTIEYEHVMELNLRNAK